MQYLFYILLGLLPSLVWLSFYLKKDKHPESNSIVLRIFIWGMLLAPLAIIFELILIWLLNPNSNPLDLLSQTYQASFIKIILAATLIPALVEEYLKYSIVWHRFLKKPEFDEPVDTMLYCIIAGLGFASVENLLILFKIPFPDIGKAFTTIGFRFLGATLVHALASGIVGYWLAQGLLNIKKRKRFILTGLTIAIIFHSCYNYLVITILNQRTYNEKLFFVSVITVLLISTTFLVSYYFKKLKQQQSICKTN
ncbi:PrsW family intramembrane metalloprotease [Patescibacteria group bacterium]|nr:PrsW family intramembrane metalloprotease [Patescibacteria group bacterium]MBU2472766.1 PrsW family intramembrane metalloprotease [Patescibacteria group bacterium]